MKPEIKTIIDRFTEDFNIPQDLPVSQVFEFLTIYCASFRYRGNSTDPSAYSTGDASGIDGVFIVINEHLVTSETEAKELLKGRASVELHFTQSKTSESLSHGELLKFLEAVSQFMNGKYVSSNDHCQESLAILSLIKKRAIDLRALPTVHLHFAFTGIRTQVTPILQTSIEDFRDRLLTAGTTSESTFEWMDSKRLFETYRQTRLRVRCVIDAPNRIALPSARGVIQSYICVVRASDFVRAITDESGRLMTFLFNDNVRDFLGSNPVNEEIFITLKSDSEFQDKFSIMNNGIAIVARGVTAVGQQLSMEDFQIVNGCQTTNVLFESRNTLQPDASVVLKVIQTEDDEIVQSIVRATNRQTSVTDEAFVALSAFHKGLEQFYESRPEPTISLFYERRNRQYATSASISNHQIVSLASQTFAFLSVFLEEPHGCYNYYGRILRENNSIGVIGQSFYPYFTSSAVVNRVGNQIFKDQQAKQLKNYKHQVGLAFRFLAAGPFKREWLNNDQQSERYCRTVLDTLRSEDKFLEVYYKAKSLINTCIKGFPIDSTGNPPYRRKEFTTRLLDALSHTQRNRPEVFEQPVITRVEPTISGETSSFKSGEITLWNDLGWGFLMSPGYDRVHFTADKWEGDVKPKKGMHVKFVLYMGRQSWKAEAISPISGETGRRDG